MPPAPSGAAPDANPHALQLIVDTAEQRDIVAAEDIYDEHDVKLWSSGQPVTRALQQRLLERKLKRPLESCLRAQDGVTLANLLGDAEAFLASGHALARAARPHAAVLTRELRQLSLHPVAQLLLTTARTSQPATYEHAVRGMVLAGAMAGAAQAQDHHFVRLALLGGLLHDIGEMYVHPWYLQADQALGPEDYRHIVAHPRIGESLLASQTDYPPELARAIGEHHERLDGSGYPRQLAGDAISPLGQLLAVVETTQGIAASAPSPLARASFALRAIPGEYASRWAGFIASAAHDAAEDLVHVHAAVMADAGSLADIDLRLAAALQRADALVERAGSSAGLRSVAAKASHLLRRLRTGWNGMGLWSTAGQDDAAEPQFERRMALGELRYRLTALQRECLWPAHGLTERDRAALQPLWEQLT
ncbi:HD domain-containing phosphohydrolase [Xylophilus sp. GW821-FHT01B05]